MAISVGSFTIMDNSKQVLQAEEAAIRAALTKMGIAAKKNIQAVVLDKGIYDTGDLYRTIDYGVNGAAQSVDIGSPQGYAAFNELGTSKTAARPFVKPGVLDNVGEYKNIVEDTLKNA